MSKVFDSYLFKYAAFCIACIILLYFIVYEYVEVSIMIFTLLGAWKTGEWISYLGNKISSHFHDEEK